MLEKALIGKAGNGFNNILSVLKQTIFLGLLRQKWVNVRCAHCTASYATVMITICLQREEEYQLEKLLQELKQKCKNQLDDVNHEWWFCKGKHWVKIFLQDVEKLINVILAFLYRKTVRKMSEILKTMVMYLQLFWQDVVRTAFVYIRFF